MPDNTILKLSKPIEVGGERVTELKLRPPIAKDVIACGMPFEMVFGQAGVKTPTDAAAVARLIVRLAAIPLSSVESLDPYDFVQAQFAIMAFFQPSAEKPGGDTPGAPGQAG